MGVKLYISSSFLPRGGVRTAELSAGGVDVRAQPPPHRGADAVRFQRPGKGGDRRVPGAGKAGLRHLVHGDQVDVDRHTFGARAQVAVEHIGKLRAAATESFLPAISVYSNEIRRPVCP